MSEVTISAIKADIGGYVGHGAVHPDLLSAAERRVRDAVADELLVDGPRRPPGSFRAGSRSSSSPVLAAGQ